MHSKLHLVWPALALTVAATGCIPMRAQRCPGAAGTVVDARTAAPVVGAEVAFLPRGLSTHTATNGTFSIPSRKSWGVMPLLGPWDPSLPTGTLQIRAPGYAPHEVLVTAKRFGETEPVSVDSIKLERWP